MYFLCATTLSGPFWYLLARQCRYFREWSACVCVPNWKNNVLGVELRRQTNTIGVVGGVGEGVLYVFPLCDQTGPVPIPNKKRRTVCDPQQKKGGQTTMKTKFTGGALSFKGDAKAGAKKKKKSKSKHSLEVEPDGRNKNPPHSTHVNQHNNINNNDHDNNNHDDDKTEAERRALIRKRERERKDLEKLAQKSHRETIEEFNEKLGELTEHNDIPRVRLLGGGGGGGGGGGLLSSLGGSFFSFFFFGVVIGVTILYNQPTIHSQWVWGALARNSFDSFFIHIHIGVYNVTNSLSLLCLSLDSQQQQLLSCFCLTHRSVQQVTVRI